MKLLSELRSTIKECLQPTSVPLTGYANKLITLKHEEDIYFIESEMEYFALLHELRKLKIKLKIQGMNWPDYMAKLTLNYGRYSNLLFQSDKLRHLIKLIVLYPKVDNLVNKHLDQMQENSSDLFD